MQSPAMTFKCKTCALELDISLMSCSHKGVCRPCEAEKMRKWRKANHEKSKEAGRRSWARRRLNPQVKERRHLYYVKNGEKRHGEHRLVNKKWRHAHKTERNAKERVRLAVRDGILIRPEFCSFCKTLCKAQAHHKDYSKPLEVIWICASCHRFAHSHLPHPVKDWLNSFPG